MPSAKEKLRGTRGAPSTEDFQKQGIRILSDLLQLLPLVWDRCPCPCPSGTGGDSHLTRVQTSPAHPALPRSTFGHDLVSISSDCTVFVPVCVPPAV